MHDIAHANHRARDRVHITYVTVDGLHLESRQIGPWARGAHEHPHWVSGTDKRAGNSRSDEPRSARHQHASDGHGVTRFRTDSSPMALPSACRPPKTSIKSAFRLQG